ncbi:hypothetical protein ABB37_08016 [Leptomonas pyrrhocoris]|uniref:Cytochrome b5 heme-binding domain-containing protein n=1 Tax=Leptomonas pyrrhocoris TaxID=157538 RepID=A0A0M9FUL9_LEPPY|nr:hypothetical protein ABB37_08016 [Leptomonas pyrrhocoris]KPA76287.1 hypothetical protein ABB37_08016 [Leptomonas pyrrhocoris]|eukprot:XP_015654726.1 hypothetical protein ABB37_08016 [Leptomonas pyrrhocoris]
MRTAWQEATEEQARHHHVLSLAFLLVVVCFLMVWCLDISSQSVMNRVFTSPQARWYHTPSSTASPSAVNTVEGNLDGVAADAKNSVKEFFALAGNFMSPQPQRYTRDEVAQHRTADDLWIVIDGNVLDVSLFIHQHPGGLVLLDGAGGQDMATVFARFHHPSSVRLFANFCIGHVVGA